MGSPYFRSAEDVRSLDELDLSGLRWTAEKATRYEAIIDVLRRLSAEEFERALEEMDTLRWFLPDPEVSGSVEVFPANMTASGVMGSSEGRWRAKMMYDLDGSEREVRGSYARIVYLSADLEGAPDETVVRTVARQIAEIVLQHRPLEVGFDRERRRNDVDRLVSAWL